MRRVFGLVLVSALLVLGFAAPTAARHDTIAASGTFTTTLDVPSLTLTPVGRACSLTVRGELDFDGTLDGVAKATTTALVFAPCEEVAAAAPGAFADVFASDLQFEGTVSEGPWNTPVTATIKWFGRTRPGGQIHSVMVIDGEDIGGGLRVKATVDVGGTYRGRIKLD